MSFETDVTIGVYTDKDYHYEVTLGEENTLNYMETRVKPEDDKPISFETVAYISFGSLAEVEAVAQAMLRAVRAARDTSSF